MDFRLFYLDGAGHVAQAVELQSPTDRQAVEAAKELADGRAMELWQRSRLVARIEREDRSFSRPK